MDLEPLYQSVLANLRLGRADLAREPLARLLREMPDDENLRLVQRQAAVVGIDYPASRKPIALARREAPAARDVDIVAFHVHLAQAPSGMHGDIDYMSVLSLSFESARIKAPAARRILITDEQTQIPASIDVDEIMRFPLDAARPMFERMRVQASYLEARPPGRVSVLMDSDVVVNADPAAVFAEDFDVGLTWRPEFPDAPFNGGVVFPGARHPPAPLLPRNLTFPEEIAAHPPRRAPFPPRLE